MKETELSINQIESAIVERVDSPFYIRRNIVIPNVSWGFLNHEADLLVISQQKKLTEIEIKRTWSDFMADFHKGHNHYDKKLSHLYFAVPYRMAERVFHWLYEGEFADNNYSFSKVEKATEHNPYKAGIIVYRDWNDEGTNIRYGRCCWVNVRAGQMNPYGEYVISDKEERKLFRLLAFRIWAAKRLAASQEDKTMCKRQSLIEDREERAKWPSLFKDDL